MRAIRKGLPSPALIVACAALVIALGGVSYASSVLPNNSAASAQCRRRRSPPKRSRRTLSPVQRRRTAAWAPPTSRPGSSRPAARAQGRPGPKRRPRRSRRTRRNPSQQADHPGLLLLRLSCGLRGRVRLHDDLVRSIVAAARLRRRRTSSTPVDGPTANGPGPRASQAAPGNLCGYETHHYNTDEARILRFGSTGQITYDAASRYGAGLTRTPSERGGRSASAPGQ